MNKNSMQELFKNVENMLKKHTSEILTGIGITGMITTTVLAVKATPKAVMLIEERKLDLNTDELDKIEIVKTAWPCYIPSLVSGTISIACIIGASSVNLQRNAALATAYTIADTARKEYRKKVVETIGENKELLVREAVAKEKLETNPIDGQEITITGNGDTLCYESLAGRYFRSDIDSIKRAVNDTNSRLLSNLYVSLNDLYEEIGIKDSKLGYMLGWRLDEGGLIDISFSSHLTSKGEPCLVMDFVNLPTYDYDQYL